MSEIDIVTLVGLFALGCIAIHGLRQHARQMTQALGLIVLCLGPFTLFVALAVQPIPTLRSAGNTTPMPKRAMGQDAQAQPSTVSSFRVAQAENAKRRGDPLPTAGSTAHSRPSDEPARTALPEQDASPDGVGEMPGSPASKNAERIK